MKCVICYQKEIRTNKVTGNIKSLAVDHCHATGKVRGLLCYNCNSSLGKFRDSIEIMARAIEYLKKSRE